MEPLAPIKPAPANVNTMAMLCHVLGFAGYIIPFGSVIGPLIMWLVKRNDSPFIDEHGKEAVNFQISLLIYTVASIVLCFVLIGFLLLLAIMVIDIVFIIQAAIKASRGEPWRYPLTIRFIK